MDTEKKYFGVMLMINGNEQLAFAGIDPTLPNDADMLFVTKDKDRAKTIAELYMTSLKNRSGPDIAKSYRIVEFVLKEDSIKTKYGYSKPCFEDSDQDDNFYPCIEVDQENYCLEDCEYLKNGGSWEDCPSGGKSDLL